jgi:hypothetical protein|tara:strand:- start:76 stop:222 length:147 start_codon:yes stop_codon:yes gene_type:complete
MNDKELLTEVFTGYFEDSLNWDKRGDYKEELKQADQLLEKLYKLLEEN